MAAPEKNTTEHDKAVGKHNRMLVIVRGYALMARLIELGSEKQTHDNWLQSALSAERRLVQVIVRDVGIFNDTLMTELIEGLGQLKETDIVMVNWGAWYPRFQYGYTEVCCSVTCTTPWSTMCCVMHTSHSWCMPRYFVSVSQQQQLWSMHL